MLSYDDFRKEMIRSRILYDSTNKRERLIGEYIIGHSTEFYDMLFLHNEGIEYKVDLKTKKCFKEPISRHWTDFGIPENANNTGQLFIGSSSVPNANLLVTQWYDKITVNGHVFEYYGTWTYEACLPIHVIAHSDTAKTNVHTSFYNIVIGNFMI